MHALDIGTRELRVALCDSSGVWTPMQSVSLSSLWLRSSGQQRESIVAFPTAWLTSDSPLLERLTSLMPGLRRHDALEILPNTSIGEPFRTPAMRVERRGTFLIERHVDGATALPARLLATSLRGISSRTSSRECVVAIPSGFSPRDRAAMLGACEDAGLIVTRIIPRSHACALAASDALDADHVGHDGIYVFIDLAFAGTEMTLASLEHGAIELMSSRSTPAGLLWILLDELQRRVDVGADDRARWGSLCTMAEELAPGLELTLDGAATWPDARRDAGRIDPSSAVKLLASRIWAEIGRLLASAPRVSLQAVKGAIVTGSGTRCPVLMDALLAELERLPCVRVLREIDSLSGARMQAELLRSTLPDRPLLGITPYEVVVPGARGRIVALPGNAMVPCERCVELHAVSAAAVISIEVGVATVSIPLVRPVEGDFEVSVQVDATMTYRVEIRAKGELLGSAQLRHGGVAP
jgi:Hsp70 protein